MQRMSEKDLQKALDSSPLFRRTFRTIQDVIRLTGHFHPHNFPKLQATLIDKVLSDEEFKRLITNGNDLFEAYRSRLFSMNSDQEMGNAHASALIAKVTEDPVQFRRIFNMQSLRWFVGKCGNDEEKDKLYKMGLSNIAHLVNNDHAQLQQFYNFLKDRGDYESFLKQMITDPALFISVVMNTDALSDLMQNNRYHRKQLIEAALKSTEILKHLVRNEKDLTTIKNCALFVNIKTSDFPILTEDFSKVKSKLEDAAKPSAGGVFAGRKTKDIEEEKRQEKEERKEREKEEKRSRGFRYHSDDNSY